jgi:alpha-glucoside transport system substrate-binding protein
MTDEGNPPMRSPRLWFVLLLALLVPLLLVACGDDDEGTATAGGTSAGTATQPAEPVSGTVSMIGVWTGEEQASFRAVLDEFENRNPDVTVRYQAAGDQLPTVLGTAVQGGNPPDLASVAQPALLRQYANRGALKPIDFARGDIEANYAQVWLDLGTVNDQLYGLFFKGSNKSLGWYNVNAFADAGVEPPATLEELAEVADTVNASGIPAYAIPGDPGWALTDLFENIYLRQAGPEKYDQLAAHEIPWTDQSVKDAMTTMAQTFFQNRQNVLGNPSQTVLEEAVAAVLTSPPDAAMIFEGDFVPGVLPESATAEAGTDYDVFDFPSVNGSEPAVVGGGDAVVMFNSTPAAQALVRFLATPDAARIWAQRGGFSSPNRNLEEDAYPDPITQRTATALAQAETFRFDLSDLVPTAFGGTQGQGMWKLFGDLQRNPGNVDRIAQQLEAAAARAD